MADKRDGGPAFPSEKRDADGPYGFTPGMSLRDWFAGMCLAGVETHGGRPELVAARAYLVADAMLAAREKSDG